MNIERAALRRPYLSIAYVLSKTTITNYSPAWIVYSDNRGRLSSCLDDNTHLTPTHGYVAPGTSQHWGCFGAMTSRDTRSLAMLCVLSIVCDQVLRYDVRTRIPQGAASCTALRNDVYVVIGQSVVVILALCLLAFKGTGR